MPTPNRRSPSPRESSNGRGSSSDDRWLTTPTDKGPKATSPALRSIKKTMTSVGGKPKLVADVNCPDCGGVLIEPGSREWCARCGYGCALPGVTLGPEEKVPIWSWVVLGGLAVLAATAVILRLLGLDAFGVPALLIPVMVGAASLGVLGVVIYLIWPSQPQRTPKQPWDG